MTPEITEYLVREYAALLTGREQIAYKHLMHTEKLAGIDDATLREKMRAVERKVGWLSEDAEVLSLLQDGALAFREIIAHKIYAEHGGEALLNKCPDCDRLARTSRAKQCRYCGHDWH